MCRPRKLSQQQLRDDPYIVWNEYVSLLATSNYRDLTEAQRAAHLVFWYDSEVQNGGHLQYFENRGIGQSNEVIAALRRLGAKCHADVFARAVALFAARHRPRIETVEVYVETALECEFDGLDYLFHECQPPLVKVLEAFLERNQAEFVMVEN
jgi:hypothetical protein